MSQLAKVTLFWAMATVMAPAFLSAADAPRNSLACAGCIGDLCMRPTQMSDQELVERYGAGEVLEDPHEGTPRQRCYFDTAQRLWVLADIYHNNDPPHLYVVGVHVSKVPLCAKSVSPRRPFQTPALSSGILIGDGESRVLEKCGKPDRVDDTKALEQTDPRLKEEPGYGSKFGERKLAYGSEGENSLLGLSIQLDAGKVTSIWLSDSP